MSAQAQPIKLLAPAAMLQMIQGFWISRAICVVAELGIPDLLTGRWFGLMAEGHFVDSDIAEAPPISHEMAIAAPDAICNWLHVGDRLPPRDFRSGA